jgi:hypothetical protein
MGDSFQQIFIVVDALDESEDRECVAFFVLLLEKGLHSLEDIIIP